MSYLMGVLICSGIFLAVIYYVFHQSMMLESLQNKIYDLEEQIGYAGAESCNEKDSISNVRNSIVRIIGGDGEGSGFAVKEDGLILTNFHVIEYEASPKVVFPDGTFEIAEIVLADKNADLAFLQVQRSLSPLTFGSSGELDQTDELYALGFPFGGDLRGELTVKKGILAGKRFDKYWGHEYLQTDSTINPGLSGGPMITRCGEVVGINTLGGSGMGFAVSSDTIRKSWNDMLYADANPLKDIKVLNFETNLTPELTVQAFYDYIKLRKHQEAYKLLGAYKKDFTYENWLKGYATNIDTSLQRVEVDGADPNKIHVYISTKDLIDGDIVYNQYEGFWIIKDVDEKYLLWDPEIQKVESMDYTIL